MYLASKRIYFKEKTIYALAKSMLSTRIILYSMLFNIFEKVRQTYCLKFSVLCVERILLSCGQERALCWVTRAVSPVSHGLLSGLAAPGQPCQELPALRSASALGWPGITPRHLRGAGYQSPARFPATHSPGSARR